MIIVFGASGFIGTYLVDQLVTSKFSVLSTDIYEPGRAYYESQGVPFNFVDVTNRDDFQRLPSTGVEAVVNLACVQPANIRKEDYDPVDFISVNVVGTLNILEYCRKAKIGKVIIATSHRNTRGLWKRGKKIREEEGRAIEFTGEYAMFSISESAAEDCVEHYRRTYGLQGIIFRLPPVYGYGPHTVIFKNGRETKTGFQTFIDSVVSGKPIEIWGDPDVGRDIIYVKDVVRAFVFALNSRTAEGLYNISSGRALSLREQVEETVKVFGRGGGDSRVVFRPEEKNSIEPFLYDNTKAKRELGWSPKYSFGDLLMDCKRELESGRFEYLVEKRRQMLQIK
jgi:UDP-glucose 4-epimerase